jgi:acyl-CoA thioesterase
MQTLSAQAVATHVGQQMYANDPATQHLGIELVQIAPGQAQMRMTVKDFMVNGHGICHGGYLFLFADSAFAFACNSHGQYAVAAGASIDFLAPGKLGDTLTAHGRMLHQANRTGVYDIEVKNQADVVLAVFRGRSATIKGSFLD